jgi:hypothetical protein
VGLEPTTRGLKVRCFAPTELSTASQPGPTAVMAVICGMFRLLFIDTAIDRDVASGNLAGARTRCSPRGASLIGDLGTGS